MARKLISARQYAKQRGISNVYVSRLVNEGKIPSHGEERRIDPKEADRARAENTMIGTRRPAWARHEARVAEGYPVCSACGEAFDPTLAKELNSPNPDKFCSDLCSGLGFTEAELRDLAALKW